MNHNICPSVSPRAGIVSASDNAIQLSPRFFKKLAFLLCFTIGSSTTRSLARLQCVVHSCRQKEWMTVSQTENLGFVDVYLQFDYTCLFPRSRASCLYLCNSKKHTNSPAIVALMTSGSKNDSTISKFLESHLKLQVAADNRHRESDCFKYFGCKAVYCR